MNRLQQDDLSVDVRQTPNRPDLTKGKSELISRHRFFIPLHYERNYAYPLFVWLHGPGGTEAEINQVMPHVSLRNYVGVATRGVVRYSSSRFGRQAYTWDQSMTSVERSMEQVLDCIDEAKKRFNIANDRVFLVGNDVGGTMALRLGFIAPQLFGGIISLGAGMPSNHQPLSGIKQVRSLPLMLAHCRDSHTFHTESVCENLRHMHAAGMKVWLRQYPCEQEVTTNMLSDVDKWIMERVVGPRAAEPTDDPTHARLEELN